MSDSDYFDPAFAILKAIRDKRGDRTPASSTEIAKEESRLLADLDAFDLEAAERAAHAEHVAQQSAPSSVGVEFPSIAPQAAAINKTHSVTKAASPVATETSTFGGSSLLSQLRAKADAQQRTLHQDMTQRTQLNEQIDTGLRRMFAYAYELIQNLNIVKPMIERPFSLGENIELDQFQWVEGFADYRSQSQSEGALIEQVTFTAQLRALKALTIERSGSHAIERFRGILFDYGLQFTCKEFKNSSLYVERAEFQIAPALSVSARWRADYEQGCLVLETRNLNRLGSHTYNISPAAMDVALFDELGRMLLGQANRFRELSRR